MPDDGSVWDDGPHYPDLWPAPSGDSANPPDPSDQTPTAPSPVDLDAVEAAGGPVAASPSPTPGDRRGDWWRGRFLGLATWIWLATLGVLLTVLVVLVTTAGGSDPELVEAPGPNASGPALTTPPTVRPPATVATGTLPENRPPETTAPVTTPSTSTDAPATSAPPEVAPPETDPPDTAPPETAPPETPTDGPIVTILGRVAPCDFGAQCLIAGFAIAGFESQPTEFVCEFADGSRYPFRFNSAGVERACATGNPDGSITIEVDGVRSETFRRD